MENNSFKSVMFGGFRRKDVIDYIEKSATESNERISTLEQTEDRLVQENAALRTDLASVTGARDRLSDALEDNFSKQEELNARLDEANAELDRLRAQLEALTAERDALRDEIAVLRPKAEEYGAVKAKIADLELAARQRAEDLENEAQQRAQALESEAQHRAEALENDTRRWAEALESETQQRAEALESDTRLRMEALEQETRERLRGMVESCRAQYEQTLSSLSDACLNISRELHRADSTVSKLPGALEALRSGPDGFEEY